MRLVCLLAVLALSGCGDAVPAAPDDRVPDPVETPAGSDTSDASGDSIWKGVRYPDCPEYVDPERCGRVISFARLDYMSPTATGEWVSVPGPYDLHYEIRHLNGELLLDGALQVELPTTAGRWGGAIFSIVLVPRGSDLPDVPCTFRVSLDDSIQDANEPTPGIIFCVNEAGTAAAELEYDRCSVWGPLEEQATCPHSEP